MEIPYTVKPRPDTGLWNAKIGIWLFLASEVMLFGGLFSAYIFLRMGAEPGYWPKGLLNIPLGMVNTIILIASSVTVIFAWASLKMRKYGRYFGFMLATILLASAFLTIKLTAEWPAKFHHYGVYIKKESLDKYEKYLANEFRAENGFPPGVEITGILVNEKALEDKAAKSIEIRLDEQYAYPTDKKYQEPHFFPRKTTDKIAVIDKEDIAFASAFTPRHSTYFATYYTITGLHGIHILGGIVVFIYFLLPVSRRLYEKDPEHLANRVECGGLFWHFVDLVWIFVFPLYYLL